MREFAAAGMPHSVEVIFADHQNKADIGASIARQWLDKGGVDAIVDVPNSAVARAVQTLVHERNKFLLAGLHTAGIGGDVRYLSIRQPGRLVRYHATLP